MVGCSVEKLACTRAAEPGCMRCYAITCTRGTKYLYLELWVDGLTVESH